MSGKNWKREEEKKSESRKYNHPGSYQARVCLLTCLHLDITSDQLVSIQVYHNSQLFFLTQPINIVNRTARLNRSQNIPSYTKASMISLFELPYMTGHLGTTPMAL